MSDSTLRNYFNLKEVSPDHGLRACFAPWIPTASLRSLINSPRVIHLSDVHFSSSGHTWNWDGGHLSREDHDGAKRRDDLTRLLNDNKGRFGTSVVVITGDLTDSGDADDYGLVNTFIKDLTDNEFQVYAVPGNHDYCWEGNLFFEELFGIVKAIDTAAEYAALAAAVSTAAGTFSVDPSGKLFTAAMSGEIAAARATLEAAIQTALRGYLYTTLPGIVIPGDPTSEVFITMLGGLFSVFVDASLAGVHVGIAMTDTASSEDRRQRFIQSVTPDDSRPYPRCVDLGNACLILLDSMQGQLDESSGDKYAQGCLGQNQLHEFGRIIADYQNQNTPGKKLVVALHHSPFKVRSDSPDAGVFDIDDQGGLDDSHALLQNMTRDTVDCLLFGHTTPKPDIYQQPRVDVESDSKSYVESDSKFQSYEQKYAVTINCENLEHVPQDGSGYRVTVVDLGSCERVVYSTDGSVERSWASKPT